MFYISKDSLVLQFETYSEYSEVADIWSSILPANHHLSFPDISATENSKPADIEFRYVNIIRDSEIIGVMYLQCLNFNSKHYNHGIFDRPFLKHLKECIKKHELQLLICGNLFRVNFQGFYFKKKEDRNLIFDCLQLYRKEIKSNKNFCGILLKDCAREFNPVQFTCYKFNSFKQDLTMELSIRNEWNDFNGYIESLTRKYRQRANKIRISAESIRKVDMSAELLQIEEDRINSLYLNIVKKQSVALGILNAEYFKQMKISLGEQFKVVGYYKEDQLLAFSSYIYYPHKNKMEIHYIGLDYSFNSEFNLYFNILFDGIEEAITKKFTTIEMGRTAREAKANAGAHAVENYNYVWIKPGLIKLAFRFIGNWFESNIGETWQNRNPFKSSSGIAE